MHVQYNKILSLSLSLTLPLSVFFCTTTGNDYTTLTSTLYYGAGSPLNSKRCVNISIIDDDVIEPDQSFAVSLATSDPVFLTPIDEATVIIATDNDSKRNYNVYYMLYVRVSSWVDIS